MESVKHEQRQSETATPQNNNNKKTNNHMHTDIRKEIYQQQWLNQS